MKIKRDWIIDFDEDQFIAVQGERFARLLARPNRRHEWKAALAEARRLVQPAVVLDSFAIHEMHHDKLVLAGGVSIGGGPVTTVVAGATDLIVAVCTIGPGVEDRAGELQRSNQMFQAMMLSDLGSWAVDALRRKLCQWLIDDSGLQGLRVSASLSPGESEWSVEDQSTIFSLIDTSPIGVSLNPSLVMSPIKSLSLIMGTGTQSMGVEGSSNCDFCTLRDRCNFRILR